MSDGSAGLQRGGAGQVRLRRQGVHEHAAGAAYGQTAAQ